MEQSYQPPEQNWWQGRQDATRIHQVIQTQMLDELDEKEGVGLCGFGCDQGVLRNGGRVGAKQGPMAIRQAMASLAFHQSQKHMVDVGNIVVASDLERGQIELAQAVQKLQQSKKISVVLGGGHETAWGHYQGLAQSRDVGNMALINFDAHFDLREADQSTSGTPFLQIHDYCQEQGIPFHYFCFGIQPQSNTRVLFETANTTKTQYWLAQAIMEDAKLLENEINILLEKFDAVYVSLCLDVFNQAFAPGVSAPAPLGLAPSHILPALIQLASSGKLAAFDCVELCPQHDTQAMTAQLAGQLVTSVLANL